MIAIRLAPRGPLGILPQAVGQEHADDTTVELYDSVLAAGRLRSPEHGAAVLTAAVRTHGLRADRHELLPHDELACLEVDVIPSQPHGFATTKPGGGDDLE